MPPMSVTCLVMIAPYKSLPPARVAVAFGADEWVIPADDDSDPDHLAQAVGARAVAR